MLFGPTFAMVLSLAPTPEGPGASMDSGPPPPVESAPPPATPPAAAPPAADAAPPSAPPPAAPPVASPPPAGEQPSPAAPDAEAAQPPGDKPPAPPSPQNLAPRQPPAPEAVSAEPANDPVVIAPQSLRDPFDPTVAAPESDTTTITVVHHRAVPPPPPPPPAYDDDDDDFFVGGFGGPSMRLTNINKKVGMVVGFRGGVLLGKRLSLGGAYYNLRRRFGPPILDDDGNSMAMKMAYGGAHVGVTIVRHDNLELNIQSLFGAGMACVSYHLKPTNYAHQCVESVRMFVAEPEAVFNVNITDWMRMGFTFGYRVVAREKWTPPNDFKLSGAHMGINFDFGWFGR